jgi:hypothetical protein
LGLGLAELFTDQNPQPAPKGIYDRVKTNPLRRFPGELGEMMKSLVGDMLERDPAERRSASNFFNSWQSVFLDAARRAHALEGRLF